MHNQKQILIININLISNTIIIFLPIIFFIGTGILNLFVVLLDIFFISEILLKKKINYFNNKFFYLLVFFWIILIINLLFSINFYNSLPRTFGFIRFIFFAFAINYYLFEQNNKYKNLIFKLWTIIFIIISIDLVYEYIFGFNTFGFKSYMPGRLSGFFNQELKIGHLYSALILFCLSYIYFYLKDFEIKNNNLFTRSIKNNLFYFFVILFSSIAFIIGERSNFIKILLMISLFLFIIENKNFYKKIATIFIGIIILTFIIFNNQDYKYRFWTMLLKPLINNPIEMIVNSNYGSHFKVGIEVFKNHKLTGVGLKNYRKEAFEEGYSDNPSIHPHQLHFELLSETGLLGYASFFFLFIYNLFYSINYFLKKRNIYQLSGILFVFFNLLPIIPSGSFFSSYGATLFWLNFGLMLPKKE